MLAVQMRKSPADITQHYFFGIKISSGFVCICMVVHALNFKKITMRCFTFIPNLKIYSMRKEKETRTVFHVMKIQVYTLQKLSAHLHFLAPQ